MKVVAVLVLALASVYSLPQGGWGGVPANANIDLVGTLGAAGEGWAAQNSAEAINVHGSGWTPAELNSLSGGSAVLGQGGPDSIVQVANVSPDAADSVQIVQVGQSATALEGLIYSASGDDIITGQSGSIATSGAGALGATGDSEMDLHP